MNNFLKKIARVDIIKFLIMISIFVILFRCFNLQYTDTKKYSNLIKGIEVKNYIIRTSRGSIVDRNNIVLAESIPMNTLIVNNTKKFLKDEKSLKKLCAILNKDYKDLLRELKNRENKNFSYIKNGRYLSSEITNKIFDLNLSGAEFITEFQRYYPEGEILAPLIGMTDFHHNGQMGIEKSFNSLLMGNNGEKIVMTDLHGKVVKEIRQVSAPKEGKKLTLTIDSRLQYVAYRELKNQVRKVNAESGSVVILDSTNGDILATASYPSYNPNDRKTYSPEKERNRVIIDSLEPASTIKPFLLAAALHSEKVNLSDNFDTSPGYRRFDNKTYKDIKNFGELTTEGVIIKSSNIGSIMISEKFNKKIFYDLLEHIGIGEKINTNFPSEVEGVLTHYSEWENSDVRSLAMGYHCKVTPLQLAKAYSVIANNGLVINPKILKSDKIQINESKKYEKEFKKVKNVIKKVIESGSAKRAAIEGYTAGGKTGTAKLYIGGNKKNKYSDDDHISLFAGITPLIKSKLVIVVVINKPKTKIHFGGYVAAPVFKKIATDSLRILNINPDNILDYQKKVSNEVEKLDRYPYKNPEVSNVF